MCLFIYIRFCPRSFNIIQPISNPFKPCPTHRLLGEVGTSFGVAASVWEPWEPWEPWDKWGWDDLVNNGMIGIYSNNIGIIMGIIMIIIMGIIMIIITSIMG